jgi:hypothetical protein
MKSLFLHCLSGCLLCLSAVASLPAQSNSHSERLPWVNGKFPSKKGAFEYMVSRGEGRSLKDARNDALNSLLIDLGNKSGVTVNSQTIAEIRSNLSYSGTSDYSESSSSVSTYRIERDGFKASFSEAGEYYEYAGGNYQLWKLYEISTTGASFKAYVPEYTTHYGLSAGWRSVIIPGWGQFHKKKTGKGIFFLTVEAAAISSAVYFETMRADNMRKSQETTNMTLIKEYRNRADNWSLYRNIAIGTAAGVYVWNVLDAALAKGKLRYAWIPDNVGLSVSEGFDGIHYGLALKF